MLTELVTLPQSDSKRFVYEFRSPYKYTRVNSCLPLYFYLSPLFRITKPVFFSLEVLRGFL